MNVITVNRVDGQFTVISRRERLDLQKGEVLQVRVVSRSGSDVTFRSSDGRVIKGRLRVDMAMVRGDTAELMVTMGEAGRTSLQILSIGRNPVIRPDPILLSLGLAQDTQAGEILRLMKRQGIKPSAEKIMSALGFWKQNPALGSKAALFFAMNGLPDSEENISAFQRLVMGEESTGARLSEIALSLADEEDGTAQEGLAPALTGDEDGATIKLQESKPDGALPEEPGGLRRSLKELIIKLLSLFINPEDHDIPHAAREFLAGTAVLKNALSAREHEGSKDDLDRAKELWTETKLTADIDRFGFLLVPFKLGRQYETVEFYFFRPGKKASEQTETVLIHIGLAMENMGRVEATLRAERKSVSLRFYLEEEDAARLAREESAKVLKSLQKLGYAVKDLQIERLWERITVANAEALLSAAAGEAATVDYRI